MNDYSTKLRAIREAEGMTQSAFAQAAGLNARSYQNAENGFRSPGLPMIEAVARRWPQYARWLLTDETRPEHGDMSPDQEKARKDSAREGRHSA